MDHFCYVPCQFLTIFESKLHQLIVILQLSCRTFGDTQGNRWDLSINYVEFAGFQKENIPDRGIKKEKIRKEIKKEWKSGKRLFLKQDINVWLSRRELELFSLGWNWKMVTFATLPNRLAFVTESHFIQSLRGQVGPSNKHGPLFQ